MELLTIGPVHDIDDEVVRALPARACILFATFVDATSIDISNADDASDPQNLVEADFVDGGGFPVAAGFIKVNGGQALITLRAS